MPPADHAQDAHRRAERHRSSAGLPPAPSISRTGRSSRRCRPAVPAVKNAAWPRNPIDNFILARLEAAGLAPAPEADRRTLARRVEPRSDRSAARPGRGRRIRQRHVARRVRAAGRSSAVLARLGRASRALLARRRPLCRHARHSLRQLPRDVDLSRLGDRRVQSQHARSRSSPSSNWPATCCPTARSTSRSPRASTAAT